MTTEPLSIRFELRKMQEIILKAFMRSLILLLLPSFPTQRLKTDKQLESPWSLGGWFCSYSTVCQTAQMSVFVSEKENPKLNLSELHSLFWQLTWTVNYSWPLRLRTLKDDFLSDPENKNSVLSFSRLYSNTWKFLHLKLFRTQRGEEEHFLWHDLGRVVFRNWPVSDKKHLQQNHLRCLFRAISCKIHLWPPCSINC